MAKVELKKPIVEEIKANLEGAATAVVVDYRGLTVEQDTQLRKNLREAGVVYKVYKNTMVNFAIEGTEFEGLKGCLEGPTGLAICKDDATAAARVLADFAKNAPALELKGGVVEGTFYDAEGIAGYCKDPFKRRAYFQVPWKYPVTYRKLRSCYQADRRAEGGLILSLIEHLMYISALPGSYAVRYSTVYIMDKGYPHDTRMMCGCITK